MPIPTTRSLANRRTRKRSGRTRRKNFRGRVRTNRPSSVGTKRRRNRKNHGSRAKTRREASLRKHIAKTQRIHRRMRGGASDPPPGGASDPPPVGASDPPPVGDTTHVAIEPEPEPSGDSRPKSTKIALLFLTCGIGLLQHVKTFEDKGYANASQYTLYIGTQSVRHQAATSSDFITIQQSIRDLFPLGSSPIHFVEIVRKTSWFNITPGYLALYEAAFEDEDDAITHAVMLSESCYPLKSGQDFYDYVNTQAPQKSIWNPMKNQGYRIKDSRGIKHNAQGTVVYRGHWTEVESQLTELSKLGESPPPEMRNTDEFYMNVINHHDNLIEHEITYTHWKWHGYDVKNRITDGSIVFDRATELRIVRLMGKLYDLWKQGDQEGFSDTFKSYLKQFTDIGTVRPFFPIEDIEVDTLNVHQLLTLYKFMDGNNPREWTTDEVTGCDEQLSQSSSFFIRKVTAREQLQRASRTAAARDARGTVETVDLPHLSGNDSGGAADKTQSRPYVPQHRRGNDSGNDSGRAAAAETRSHRHRRGNDSGRAAAAETRSHRPRRW